MNNVLKEIQKMSAHNALYNYAEKAMIAFNDVMPLDSMMPSIKLTLGESDYCGMMKTSVVGGYIQSACMVLCLEEIINLADVDDIDIEQATMETLYHEWIHYVHCVAYPDSYKMRMTHSSDLWDEMITIGIANGFIHRRDI